VRRITSCRRLKNGEIQATFVEVGDGGVPATPLFSQTMASQVPTGQSTPGSPASSDDDAYPTEWLTAADRGPGPAFPNDPRRFQGMR
jgi:hypothetical protein